MSRTTYGISWLYGEFRIARFRNGAIEAEWEAPSLVNSQADLVRALDEACDHMDLTIKGEVTVVHEHDLHTHEYLEVPKMKRKDLEKYLLRQVERSKEFEEPAAWCYHEVSHQGGKQGVLLHQLPKSIVDATVAACTAVGLAPKRYVPLTEIVSDYLPTTSIESEQLAVVIACFDQRIEIIVVLGDGEALFVRELNYGAHVDTAARLVTDVNRTIRYARQQLGRAIDIAWVMGHPEWPVVERLRSELAVRVEFDAEGAEPNFWSLWATKLSGKLSANFISVFAQKNITGELARRAGVFATAATVLIAVLLTLFTSGLVAHRGEQIEQIEVRSEMVRSSITDLESILRENQTKQEHLLRLRAASHNLPSLMMLHLSRMAPPQMTFTEVSIEQSQSGWQFSMSGLVAGDMRQGARILANFEEKLQQPPWRVGITKSFRDAWMEQFEQGLLEGESGLGFAIEGEVI